jgi:hypothetical protein
MLDHHEGEQALGRDVAEELLERFQAPGGGAYANDHRALRLGSALIFLRRAHRGRTAGLADLAFCHRALLARREVSVLVRQDPFSDAS